MRMITICAMMSFLGCASDSEPVSKQQSATSVKPTPDKAKSTKTSVEVAKHGGCPHASKHAGCPHADKHAGCPHAASAEKHHAHGGCPHAKKTETACDCDKTAGSGCPHGKKPESCPHHKPHGADHTGCKGCPSYDKSDDWPAAHAKKLQKLVKLTEAQTAKAKAFFTTFGPKMREVRTQLKKAHHGELKLADAQLKALGDKKAKLTKERDAGLQKILTAKQFESFKKLLDHHGECPCSRGKKDN